MGYLILGFSCSALVSIVLKASGNLDHDRYGMLTVNYMACLIPFIISQIGRDLPAMDLDFGICIAAAAANSLLYIAGMVMNQINARRSGAILQSAFARLGVMVPVLISIIAFGERPTAMQTIAIALVLLAFCLMNIPQGSGSGSISRPAFALLLLGLLFGGLADSMLKVFEVFGSAHLDDWFMGATFIFAALLCLAATIAGKGRIVKNEIAIGIMLGIPNYLSSLFLLKSLSSVSAYIAYPTYSVGAILVVMTVSIAAFRERLPLWSRVGIALIVPAIILLNL